MRPARWFVAALGASALLAGCGGSAGDLLSIEVSGGPAGAGAAHTIVVSGDGRGSCDRGELQALPSERVIVAREVERDVGELAREAADYPQRSGARRYELKTDDGVVRWSEGGTGLPEVLPKAQLMALQLERQLCD